LLGKAGFRFFEFEQGKKQGNKNEDAGGGQK
jgi:hypothetical protein